MLLFSLLTSWWSSIQSFCCGRDTFRRVQKKPGIGGWLGEPDVWSVLADLLVLGFVVFALRQGFFGSGRIPVGGIRACWR